MATTMTLQALNFCAAGNHFTLTASGDVNFTTTYEVADFVAPLTDAEKTAFLKALCRFAKVTRTAAQVKSGLIAGVTISV